MPAMKIVYVAEIVAATIPQYPQISTSFNRVCRNPLNRMCLIIGSLAKNGFSALGAGGPQFKSACPDHLKSSTYSRRCPNSNILLQTFL
jgi:hypothetical protein